MIAEVVPAGHHVMCLVPPADASALLGERAGDGWISQKITTNGVISSPGSSLTCGKRPSKG